LRGASEEAPRERVKAIYFNKDEVMRKLQGRRTEVTRPGRYKIFQLFPRAVDFDQIAAAFNARGHCTWVGNALSLLRRWRGTLLLLCLIDPFVTSSETSRKTTHACACSGALARITRDRTADRHSEVEGVAARAGRYENPDADRALSRWDSCACWRYRHRCARCRRAAALGMTATPNSPS
jgi:hypothetical protein